MFGKKKNLKSEEFEALMNKIILCVGDIDANKSKLAVLETNLNSLRGKINRESNPDDSKDINTKDPRYLG